MTTRSQKRAAMNLRVLTKLKRRRMRRSGGKNSAKEDPMPVVGPSDVYREDPYDVTERSDAMAMDVLDFWNFANRAPWQGRLRVCDGELMRKLIDSYENLVQNKIIAKVITTRNFTASETKHRCKVFSSGVEYGVNFNDKPDVVVRATFTYYGGLPLRRHRKVLFAATPNSVFTPRIRHSLPIIKYDSGDARRNSKVEALTKLQSQFAPLFPRMAWDSGSSESHDEWFISPIPADFATRCIKAAQDFVVVKEQFTDNETWRTVTSITFSRKETKWKTYLAFNAMKSFYTSKEFPMYSYALEKRAKIPKCAAVQALRASTR